MTIAVSERHGAPANLAEQMRYASALADASLVPDSFKRQPPNILVALAISTDLGESPWTVMSEMSVIGGKPSFSAKFMRSRVRKAGHRLRESYADGVARCVIIRADDPEFEHVAEWDEAKARAHDLWGKGHWKKNPQLMLKNRALSECVREACYEVMGGIGYTPDEVADFTPAAGAERPAAARPAVVQMPTSAASLRSALAKSLEKAADQADLAVNVETGEIVDAEPVVTLADVDACTTTDELNELWPLTHDGAIREAMSTRAAAIKAALVRDARDES